MEYYILNDIELSFKDVLKRSLAGEPLVDSKLIEEWSSKRKQPENGHKEDDAKEEEEKEGEEKKENGEAEKMDTDENDEVKKSSEEKDKAEKVRAVDKSAILAPQLNLQQIEAAIAKGGGVGYDQEMINDLMAQTYAASVRWPRDKVLMVRLQHILTAVTEDAWPVPANYTLLEAAAENGIDAAVANATAAEQNNRDTSTPLSEVITIFSCNKLDIDHSKNEY